MTSRELFLRPQFPPGEAPPVSKVRSTLLSASLQSIRQMGWEERYYAALPRGMHDEMRLLTPGVWLPLDVGVAHYTACDGMNLSSEEKERMGKEVSLRTQRTFVGTLGSVAAGAGATPWSVFGNTHRIWARIFDGGDHCIYRVGPKDALIVVSGCRLLAIPYFRGAIRSYYAALAGLVATAVHSRESPEHRTDSSAGMRFSWA